MNLAISVSVSVLEIFAESAQLPSHVREHHLYQQALRARDRREDRKLNYVARAAQRGAQRSYLIQRRLADRAERARRIPPPIIPPLPRLFPCDCGERFVTEHSRRTHQAMRCSPQRKVA